jgi:hypothetical protein
MNDTVKKVNEINAIVNIRFSGSYWIADSTDCESPSIMLRTFTNVDFMIAEFNRLGIKILNKDCLIGRLAKQLIY